VPPPTQTRSWSWQRRSHDQPPRCMGRAPSLIMLAPAAEVWPPTRAFARPSPPPHPLSALPRSPPHAIPVGGASLTVVAVNQLLLRQADQLASGNVVDALNASGCGERPAAATSTRGGGGPMRCTYGPWLCGSTLCPLPTTTRAHAHKATPTTRHQCRQAALWRSRRLFDGRIGASAPAAVRAPPHPTLARLGPLAADAHCAPSTLALVLDFSHGAFLAPVNGDRHRRFSVAPLDVRILARTGGPASSKGGAASMQPLPNTCPTCTHKALDACTSRQFWHAVPLFRSCCCCLGVGAAYLQLLAAGWLPGCFACRAHRHTRSPSPTSLAGTHQ
jgi:hypothetical protein